MKKYSTLRATFLFIVILIAISIAKNWTEIKLRCSMGMAAARHINPK